MRADARDAAPVGPEAPRVVSPELAHAHAFLATLTSPRESWVAAFEAFADARGLSDDMRRAVKVAVLKIRMFGAIPRSMRRRRP